MNVSRLQGQPGTTHAHANDLYLLELDSKLLFRLARQLSAMLKPNTNKKKALRSFSRTHTHTHDNLNWNRVVYCSWCNKNVSGRVLAYNKKCMDMYLCQFRRYEWAEYTSKKEKLSSFYWSYWHIMRTTTTLHPFSNLIYCTCTKTPWFLRNVTTIQKADQ